MLQVTLQVVLHSICSTTEKHNNLNVLPCWCHQLYFIFRIKAAKVNISCQMTHININPLYKTYTYVWLPILLLSYIDHCNRNISWFPFCSYFLLNMSKSYVQGTKAVKYNPFFLIITLFPTWVHLFLKMEAILEIKWEFGLTGAVADKNLLSAVRYWKVNEKEGKKKWRQDSVPASAGFSTSRCQLEWAFCLYF